VPGLERFLEGQRGAYDQALRELRAGDKQSHWMWFIFPQLAALGRSATARFYGISDLAEAQAYLADPVLGPRLGKCTDAMLGWSGKLTAVEILGHVDALKFASCMTLFESAGGGPQFGEALDAFNGGERDKLTLAIVL
jgi:uncharacterized protein (DUF1810 family)